MHQKILIKIGGSFIDDSAALQNLSLGIRKMVENDRQLLLVHGGGKDIQAEQKIRGLAPRFIDGLRYTDEETMKITEMVLSGTVNKKIVSFLAGAGLKAAGISGRDANTVSAKKLEQNGRDFGRVGEIIQVNPELLQALLASNFTPVLSPIGSDAQNLPLNINADTVASKVASALKVDVLIFYTDVDGIQVNGRVLPDIRIDQIEDYIASGEIHGGMIPKVRGMMGALSEGVGKIKILNGKKPGNLAEDLENPAVGTSITN